MNTIPPAKLTHPLIFCRQNPEDRTGDLVLGEDLSEGGHEGTEPLFAQGREEEVPALSFREGGVDTRLGGADVQPLGQAHSLRRRAQQRPQSLRQRRQQQQTIAALAVAYGHDRQTQSEAWIPNAAAFNTPVTPYASASTRLACRSSARRS